MGLQPSTRFNQHRLTLVHQRRYPYRLYPHPHQQTGLAKVFGWARVVWNDALALRNRLHQEARSRSSLQEETWCSGCPLLPWSLPG